MTFQHRIEPTFCAWAIGDLRLSLRYEHKKVTLWMVVYADEHGDENIASKAVAEFLGNTFPNPNCDCRVRKANLSKARSFLNSMQPIGSEQFTNSTSRCNGQARMRFHRKSRSGRGRKRPERKVPVHEALLNEFEELHSANVKTSTAFLTMIAKHMAEHDELDVPVPNGAESITPYPIRDFCQLHNIVGRMQSGSRTRSPAWMEYYDRSIA